jgi:hypothetical protein
MRPVSWRRTPRWAYAALAASFAASLRLGAEWNARLVVRPVAGQRLAAQDSGDDGGEAGGGDGRAYQKLRRVGAQRVSEYGFTNFNQDKLDVTYRVADAFFRKYNNEYGYRTEDVKALQAKRDASLQASYKYAVKARKDQAWVNADAARIETQYKRDLHAYMESRGFLLLPDNTTRIDMPAVVKRNGPLLAPLAGSIDRIATRKGYRSMDIIGSVLSLVQTAIAYRQPQAVWKDKHTGGILPPITTLVLGWGDCDTKTALTASLLSNWGQMRMVGISVPGHYLMAVLQIPDKGDMYVEYKGLQYVLMEPAGPAWLPPGRVADTTVALLNGSDGYRIYPFF